MTQKQIFIVLGLAFVCAFLYRTMSHVNVHSRGSYPILKRLRDAENNWRESLNRRHDYMASKPLEKFKPWGDVGFTVVWNLFAPTFDCPFMRRRIGGIGDGGKWVCGFEVFEETQSPCVVYSFGVSYESSFEAEILEKTNCNIFAYDMTVDKMGPQIGKYDSRIRFQKIGLGSNDSATLKTLDTIMRENGHTWIDILKVDIEGAEFKIFDELLNNYETLPFGQLQIEIHLQGYSFPKFYKWFERMEIKGLRPFSSEINLNPCIRTKEMPELMEYSFLNVRINHDIVPGGFKVD